MSYLPPPPSSPIGPQNISNNQALISMILGIVSIPFTLLCLIGILLAIPAIILGIMGLKTSNELAGTGKGMAIAGIVTGGVSVLLVVALVIFSIFAAASNSNSY